jgi:hypothetical protein
MDVSDQFYVPTAAPKGNSPWYPPDSAVWTDTGVRNPDRPARRESLYRLIYIKN